MEAVAWWPSVAVMAAASAIDLRSRRVPNWITVPYFVAGLTAQAITGGWRGLAGGFAAVGLAVVIFGLPAFLRAMGMGDFKLAAGVAAWIGPGQFFTASILTAIAGGIMAVAFCVWKGSLGASLNRTGDILLFRSTPRPRMGSEAARAQSIPYAPAIAIGTLLSFFAN